MNLAILLYRDLPQPPPEFSGIPSDWPARVIELGAGTQLPGPEWLLMTSGEYSAYRQLHQGAYDAWATSREASAKTARDNNIATLVNLFAQMQTAEDNWASLTNAQRDALLRAHNQAILRLATILKDQYSRQ